MGNGVHFALAIVSALTLGAADSRASIPVGDWCDRPLESLCEGSKVGKLRAASMAEYEAKASAAALKRVLAQFKARKLSDIPFFQNIKALAYLKLYTQYELAQLAATWETEFYGNNLPTVYQYLLKAIDRETEQGRLSKSTAGQMKKTLGEVRYIQASEIFKLLNEDLEAQEAMDWVMTQVDSDLPWTRSLSDFSPGVQLAYKMVQLCGEDVTTDQAFLSTINGISYAVFCPGMILRDVALAADSTEAFEAMLLIAAHELGHAIDGGSFSQDFSALQSCVATEFGGDLYLFSGLKGDASSNKYKAGAHLGEISADFWATRALEVYLRELPTAEVRREVTKRAWSDFCSEEMRPELRDEGTHPAPTVRFTITMGRSAEARELLGCSCRATGGSCGLKGVQ